MVSKADKTKQFIIETTAPIFNIKGYSGTSLSDITQATGLTKGSIYGNFENKDEVALAAFHYNVSLLNNNLDRYMSDRTGAAEKLIAFTEFYRENWQRVFRSGGCPLLNTAVEADDHLLFLKEKVQRSFKGWQDKIASVIEKGKQEDEFRKELVASEYAALFIILIEGGIIMAKTLNSKKHLMLALDRIVSIMNTEMLR